jgi:hypothetical protein
VEPDLVALAIRHGSDKWGRHWYARHYETHFAPRRLEPLTLLEIGVGGYDDVSTGGESLRMWKEYFPQARVFGIDVADKSAVEEDRIRVFRGRQQDLEFLDHVTRATGPLDVVIDDGSHRNTDVIVTFQSLFPRLREGGIYAIEDTQTSYWPTYGGSLEMDAPHTTMSLLKRLADGLNHAEWIRPGYEPGFLDLNVASVHFYHNLVFVYRGRNDEESNVLRANVPPAWLIGG